MAELLKPALSFEEQLALLEKRGIVVYDREKALTALRTKNYYRISGYALDFRMQGTDNYIPGTEISMILALYNFDENLRHILISALERIEIKVRTQIAYSFSRKYGPYGHYMEWNFRDLKLFEEFQNTCDEYIDKNRNTLFIAHHIKKYSTKENINVPLWVLVEILTFSTISKFYSNISYSDQQTIAAELGCSGNYLTNHLHCLANLRNVCAHYGRVYGRTLHPNIKLHPDVYLRYNNEYNAQLQTNMLFGYIIGMKKLMDESDYWVMIDSIDKAMDNYHSILTHSELGFPPEWKSFLLQC